MAEEATLRERLYELKSMKRGEGHLSRLIDEHGSKLVAQELWSVAAEADEEELPKVFRAIGEAGARPLAGIVIEHGLKHREPDVRVAAVKALAALREPVSLSSALKDKHPAVAAAAAEGLAEMGEQAKEVASALAEHGLQHSFPKVVRASARALAGAGEFQTLFEKGIGSGTDLARQEAARALGAAGHRGVSVIESLGLRSDSVPQRVTAAIALGKIAVGEPEGRVFAVNSLINHMYADPQLSRTVRMECQRQLEEAAEKLEAKGRRIRRNASKEEKAAAEDAAFMAEMIRDALEKRRKKYD
ncbi:MAG: HEAT repeat domain-containing protein [Candidatus Micrarchaeota archaeon]